MVSVANFRLFMKDKYWVLSHHPKLAIPAIESAIKAVKSLTFSCCSIAFLNRYVDEGYLISSVFKLVVAHQHCCLLS